MTTASGAGVPLASQSPLSDRLDSWKEIAAHLRRAERTVRRWEQTEGLPVHRHPHQKRSSIYAYKAELDAWWRSRQADLDSDPAPEPSGSDSRSRRHLWRAVIVISVVVFATVGLVWTRTLRTAKRIKAPQVRSLTAYQGFETAPSFSPDGTRLAFVWNGEQQDNFDIYVRMVDESAWLRLTTSAATDYNPVWSPDGRFIAFLRSRDGSKADILVMSSLGGGERKIGEARPGSLNDPLLAWISHLAWSHDGRSLIVPDADPSTKSQSLFEVSTITGEKRPITRALAFSMGDDSPSVSPDGRMLAFVRSPTIAAGDIYLLPLTPAVAAERSPKRLTFENGYVYNPMWTPDSQDIVYVTYLDGNTVFKRMPVGGMGESRVVFTVGQKGTSTAMSPEGDRLVYAAAAEDLDIAISSLGTLERAERPRRLISSTRTDMSPQISPDGTRIAFASRRSGPMEIWVSDREGANAVRLTPSLLYSGAPRWSPDGRAVAFGSIVDGNDDIFTVSPSGGPVLRVTDHAARDVVASWSRDGQSIYFASNRTGTFEIWKMPERGGPARQITKGGGYGGFESSDGRCFYYAKNNSFPTSLWRVAAEGGDEQPLLPSLHRWSHFAVFEDGIYFVPSISPPAPSAVQFYDFGTRTINTVATIQAHTTPGLAVSPDRRWVLYVVHERIASDLMLLEHFP